MKYFLLFLIIFGSCRMQIDVKPIWEEVESNVNNISINHAINQFSVRREGYIFTYNLDTGKLISKEKE